jgi:hypothetical protein
MKIPNPPVIASACGNSGIEVCSESCDISVAFTKSADQWIFYAIVRHPDYKKRDLSQNHAMPDGSFRWPYGFKTKRNVFSIKETCRGKKTTRLNPLLK